jgi:hypothetical protein
MWVGIGIESNYCHDHGCSDKSIDLCVPDKDRQDGGQDERHSVANPLRMVSVLTSTTSGSPVAWHCTGDILYP